MIKLGNNNIGKIYLGSNPIVKAYLGSNLVYQSGVAPGPVTTIPYIRGGADGSYIDTGITADNTVKVIVWARNWNPQGGTLFGSSVSDSSGNFAITASSGAQTGNIRIHYAASVATIATDQFANLSGYHKYELYKGVLKIDDVTIATGETGSFSNGLNIHLFGRNLNGNHPTTTCPIDIYSCKIYKNDVLVRDFTAVNSPSVGLYDAVSDTVFTNAGSGSFTYGSFNQNAYTPLEYIGCTAEQYFGTGLYGNQNTKVVTKFRPTGTEKTYYRLYGTRNSNEGSTLMTELMIGNTSYANRYFYYRYKAADGTIYNAGSQTNNDLVFVQNGNSFALYKNNSQLGDVSTTSASFTTTYTMYVGSSNLSGSGAGYPFYGYIYYIGFGSDKNFVPAKVNNVAGMYDTYNDVFYPSTSGTSFIAGPEL